MAANGRNALRYVTGVQFHIFVSLRNLKNALRDLARVRIRVRLGLGWG